MKKLKVFDSICFRGELNLLKFRLHELNSYVEHFIVADFNYNYSLEEYSNITEEFKNKISKVDVNDSDYLKVITSKFKTLGPDFEDILTISNTNEVPNYSKIEIFREKLNFEPFRIIHENFIWNYEYIDNIKSRGSIVLNLSFLLKFKSPLETLSRLYSTVNLSNDKLLDNGWKFSNFGYDPNYDIQIKELLPPTEINPISTYKLIKHNGNIPLPKNLHLLPYFKIGRDEVKRHLFLVESDLEFVNQDYYDTITIINFDSNIQEKLCKKVSDKITESVLYLPSKVLYGDPETFKDEYMMNETKRMFSVVFPQEQDIIEVIFKNEKPLVLGGVSN